MKPPDDAKKTIVNEWLGKANADLALAEFLLSHEIAFPNAIALHCQQAAEKYLKTLLTWWDIEFPKTHELARLIQLVETKDSELAASLSDVIALTPYAVALRYPGDEIDATAAEAREAVQLARQVRDAVVQLVPVADA